MIELRKIDNKSKDKKLIKKIFVEAFPPEERPPYWILQWKAKKSIVDFDGIYDGEKLVGLTYVVRGSGIAYLFFLAIKKEERGHGYGGQVLEILKERYKGSRFFLALEQLDETAENYEQRLSRHSFYERCGLRDMPYQIKEASVIYDVMGIGGKVEPEEYRTMIDEYLGPFIKKFISMKFINK